MTRALLSIAVLGLLGCGGNHIPARQRLSVDSPGALCFDPTGRTLAVGAAVGVEIWNTGTWRRTGRLATDTEFVNTLACGQDGRLLLAGEDSPLQSWDPVASRLLAAIDTGPVRSLAAGPNGRTVVTSNGTAAAVVWDFATRRQLRPLVGSQEAVLALALSPDATTLAVGKSGLDIEIFDVSSGRRLRRLKAMGDSFNRVEAVAVSGDGKLLATGTSIGWLEIWDLASGRSLHSFRAHVSFFGEGASVEALAFGPQGQLASGGADGTVRLWNPQTGRQRALFSDHSRASLSWNPDLRLWPNALAFSPDGSLLASSHQRNVVRIWKIPG